jgi:hypothetical protein
MKNKLYRIILFIIFVLLGFILFPYIDYKCIYLLDEYIIGLNNLKNFIKICILILCSLQCTFISFFSILVVITFIQDNHKDK